MNWCYLWISLCVFSVFLKRSKQCTPPEGWSPMQPHRRAQKAGIVVYGTVVSTPRQNHSSTERTRFYGVVLHVHCIVKGPKLPEYIRVAGFSNFTGGLCVHSKAFLNKSYVIFIKKDIDIPERFRVLEVNLQKGAMHPGHKLSVLREVMSFVGENASKPLGSKSDDTKAGCPHFKRRFREPAAKSKHHKPCRCRRKRLKRKKRKRIKGTARPRNHHRHGPKNVTDVPTFPRTRRYHVVTFDEDNVSSVNILRHDDVASFSLNSHQLNTYCLWWLVTLQFAITSLLPT